MKIPKIGNFSLYLHCNKNAPMNVIFSDEALKEIYLTKHTKSRKYTKLCKNAKLVNGYIRAVDYMIGANTVSDLSKFSFLHYEKLKHCGRSSVRIANGCIERLIFTESENGVEINLIEINDTHYGNK